MQELHSDESDEWCDNGLIETDESDYLSIKEDEEKTDVSDAENETVASPYQRSYLCTKKDFVHIAIYFRVLTFELTEIFLLVKVYFCQLIKIVINTLIFNHKLLIFGCKRTFKNFCKNKH